VKRTIIIAEAGVNHNGSMALARELIDAAAASGSDYVKFQTFKTELIISENAAKANYQLENAGDKSETQFDMAKKLELSFEDFKLLKYHCITRNIGFLSTGFDSISLDFLKDLGQDYFKIPSGEITNKPFLQQIGKFGIPVLLSTGMANLKEIQEAIFVLNEAGMSSENITVLHCNTEYPTPMTDVNLLAMKTIQNQLNVRVGYSDHTLGIEVPIAAVTLGAEVIEKHITLDRSMAGPDHRASLEPAELNAMVASIRNIEKAISGNGLKVPSPSETPNISVARRSIHLNVDLQKGEIIKFENLIMKRPGNGISPMKLEEVVGKRMTKMIKAGNMLEWDNFCNA
jgi:N-acetylneuraminate synthase/N,N'-diacetyllegionaminate synthase